MSSMGYKAGFFDGEGSVSISTTGNIQVAIAQKDPFILYKFAEEYGGSVHLKSKKFSTGYSWRLCGAEKIKKFLEDIQPEVIVKKEDVRLGLEIVKLINSDNSGCNPLSNEAFDKRMKLRSELMLRRHPNKRGENLMSKERLYRDSIKEQFDYKCSDCDTDLKDEGRFSQIIVDGKLICRTCHGKKNTQEKKVRSEEEIIEAIETSSNLDEAAKKLNLGRSALFKKRKKLGLDMKCMSKMYLPDKKVKFLIL